MEELKNKELAGGIFEKFFHFYASKRPVIGDSGTYDEYEQLAEDFLETVDNKTEDIQILLDSNAKLSEEDISFPADRSRFEKLLFLFGFINFFAVLRNLLTGIKPEDEYEGFVRQSSPPLDAYKYVGHNDPDITKSDRSYSLLFE